MPFQRRLITTLSENPSYFNEILLIPYQRPFYILLETPYYFIGDPLLFDKRYLASLSETPYYFIADSFLPHYRPLTIFTYWRPHFISLETPRVLLWYSTLTCQKLLTSFETLVVQVFRKESRNPIYPRGNLPPPYIFCDNSNSILARKSNSLTFIINI